MSMSTRQHYVPQFLLRHFAPEQHPSQVWTYDKRVGAGRLQSIRDSGHQSAVIIVPLCPTLGIMLFPSRFQSDLELAGAWYRPEIGVLDEAQPTAPGDVDSANAMSVFTSNRFVFSSTEDFTDVELLLRANPAATKGPVGNRDDLAWPSCD